MFRIIYFFINNLMEVKFRFTDSVVTPRTVCSPSMPGTCSSGLRAEWRLLNVDNVVKKSYSVKGEVN